MHQGDALCPLLPEYNSVACDDNFGLIFFICIRTKTCSFLMALSYMVTHDWFRLIGSIICTTLGKHCQSHSHKRKYIFRQIENICR